MTAVQSYFILGILDIEYTISRRNTMIFLSEKVGTLIYRCRKMDPKGQDDTVPLGSWLCLSLPNLSLIYGVDAVDTSVHGSEFGEL